MHMLESYNGPEHLVVFITSDQDFSEKIQELQRRNFKVAVIYHGPHASKRPASIIHAADESYDWLDFLSKELKMPKLTMSPYNSAVTRPTVTLTPASPTTPPKADIKPPDQLAKVHLLLSSVKLNTAEDLSIPFLTYCCAHMSGPADTACYCPYLAW